MITTIEQLRTMGLAALKRMYRPRDGIYAFRLRRAGGKLVLEGISRRYSAIALISLAGKETPECMRFLSGLHPQDACRRLVDEAASSLDLGEVALAVWAARALRNSQVPQALDRLREMCRTVQPCPILETSWALSALTVDGAEATDMALARSLAARLMESQMPDSGLFPHWPRSVSCPWFSQLACFADMVYPIHALANFHRATGDLGALAAAWSCAQQMCSLQDTNSQWWWHFDVPERQARQPAPAGRMQPGPSSKPIVHADGVSSGLQESGWLDFCQEIGDSPIDTSTGITCRKIARQEQARRSERLRADTAQPGRRTRKSNMVFVPGEIDCEDRPDHMGWTLYAWPAPRQTDLPQA